MVVERPLTGFSAWDGGGARRPLSPQTVAAGALIVAVHAAGALCLYQIKAAAPPLIVDQPALRIEPVVLHPDHPPPRTDTPPRQAQVHQSTATIDHTVTTLPVPIPDDPPLNPPVGPTTFTDHASGDTGPVGPPKPHAIENPRWLVKPTAEQLTQYYPERALRNGVSGEATLDCKVTAQGQLTRCVASAERPGNYGFGDAALKLAGIFRMSPKTEDGRPVEGGEVHIPIHFTVAQD